VFAMEKLLSEDMSGCLPEQLVDDMTALEDSRQYNSIVMQSNEKNSQLQVRSNGTRSDVSNGHYQQAPSIYGWEGRPRKIVNHTDVYSSSDDMEWIARGFGAACMLDHASVDGAKQLAVATTRNQPCNKICCSSCPREFYFARMLSWL
jgi:hypothetical protein